MKRMKYDRMISRRLLEMFESTNEPVATVVGIHLLVDHGLRYLISEATSSPPPVMKRLLSLRFEDKARLLCDLGLIPEELRDNHAKLNEIRRRYVHHLDFDLSELSRGELDFYDPENRVTVRDFQGQLSSPSTNEESCNVLAWVGMLTFGWQHNLIIEKYLGP